MFVFAHDEDRTGRRPHHLLRSTADAEISPACVPMCGDDNKIGLQFIGCFDDLVRGQTLPHRESHFGKLSAVARAQRARRFFSAALCSLSEQREAPLVTSGPRPMKDLILLVIPDTETERLVRETAEPARSILIARHAGDALALTAAKIHRLAMVMVDLDRGFRGMPLLTALEIAHVPTIAITASNDPTLPARATGYGAMDSIRKPVSADWLTRALDFLVPLPAKSPLCLAA